LDQQLSPLQILGIAIILASVWISQRSPQKPRLATATP